MKNHDEIIIKRVISKEKLSPKGQRWKRYRVLEIKPENIMYKLQAKATHGFPTPLLIDTSTTKEKEKRKK